MTTHEKPQGDQELIAYYEKGARDCLERGCETSHIRPEDTLRLLSLARGGAERLPLFQAGTFTGHSGEELKDKIECDALTHGDWKGLAARAVKLLPPFGSVEGIPRGGLAFAEALRPYVTEGPLLIADDVCTTGESFKWRRQAGRESIGVTAFLRGECPPWVTPVLVTGDVYARKGAAEGLAGTLNTIKIALDANEKNMKSGIFHYLNYWVDRGLAETAYRNAKEQDTNV